MKASTKAALIGAVATIIASAIAIGWDAYNKRSVIDYSFSTQTPFFFNPNELSNREGFIEPKDYQTMNFYLRNRGVNDGSILVTIVADGAKVAIPSIGQYNNTITGSFHVAAEGEWLSYNFNLKPTESPQTITLTLSVSGLDAFNQISPPSINKLVYDKDQAGYRLRGT